VLFLGLLWRRNARHQAGASQEELQRQVIRLLDDVEGSQGDLTVRAEVSADVLGQWQTRLTIQNLRKSCNK